MNLSACTTTATERLKQAGIDNPSLDARLLIGFVLNLDRAQILSQSTRELTPDECAAIDAVIDRRATFEPVARITGSREFWGHDFGLNEDTLIPRPDSETLVEAVLKKKNDAKRILDLGTGTGCLLLSLLSEIPTASGIGTDIAPRALEQASKNAAELGLLERTEFRQSSWLDEVDGTFDIIVSNPPYIPTSDIDGLMPDVRDYDPTAALDGGEDGLEPYRSIIPEAKNMLNPGGILALEFGFDQAEAIAALLRLYGYQNIEIHKDLGGNARCATAFP